MPWVHILPRVRPAGVDRADRVEVGGVDLGGNTKWYADADSPYQLEPPAADNQQFVFAFWSIRHAANGNYVTLSPSAVVAVGGSDVLAEAWYARPDDKPKGGGVLIDAFDMDAGAFFDEPFVAVLNSSSVVDQPLTDTANQKGIVLTPQLWLVKAEPSVLAKGAETTYVFNRWECIEGKPEMIGGNLLAAATGIASQAVAFYSRQATARRSTPLRPIAVPIAGTWVSWGVKVDGGGPTGGGPIGPGPMLDIVAGVALAELADKLDRTVRASVLKIAAKQLALASGRLQKAVDAAAKAGDDAPSRRRPA